MNLRDTYIIGAGVTGLSAGYATGFKVFEAKDFPGGICASYYLQPGSNRCLPCLPKGKEAYRFEIGGGHWIFGAGRKVNLFLNKFSSFKEYRRESAVYFSKEKSYIPYPLQNNLRFLRKSLIEKALKEIGKNTNKKPPTMKQWLNVNFGPSLCDLFFYPFHRLYTAGLYEEIAPQDAYKTPVNLKHVREGARENIPPAGYNVSFLYPEKGLDVLLSCLADCCDVAYGKKLVKIDIKRKKIYFQDGSAYFYKRLISTIPLNKLIEIAGIKIDEEPEPYTSVLVLNIGALKGKACPAQHWLYISDSKPGFHRIGFYSNVDQSFLPNLYPENNHKVSLYVEKSWRGGSKPSAEAIEEYIDLVVGKLKSQGFIEKLEVADASWVDVAYTWHRPGAKWKQKALTLLKAGGVESVGRFGGWRFQGIAESAEEGLALGEKLRGC